MGQIRETNTMRYTNCFVHAGRMSRCLAAAIAAAGAFVVRAGTLQIQLPSETNSFKQDVGAELANALRVGDHILERLR